MPMRAIEPFWLKKVLMALFNSVMRVGQPAGHVEFGQLQPVVGLTPKFIDPELSIRNIRSGFRLRPATDLLWVVCATASGSTGSKSYV